ELQTADKKHSSKTVIQKMKPKGDTSFFAQAKIFVDNLETAGKYNRHKTESGRIKNFRAFVGSDIGFRDLTVTLLNQFKAYLQGERKIKERTITDKTDYPFGKDKI